MASLFRTRQELQISAGYDTPSYSVPLKNEIRTNSNRFYVPPKSKLSNQPRLTKFPSCLVPPTFQILLYQRSVIARLFLGIKSSGEKAVQRKTASTFLIFSHPKRSFGTSAAFNEVANYLVPSITLITYIFTSRLMHWTNETFLVFFNGFHISESLNRIIKYN